MDARLYLKNYGWQDGQALKNGGIKKPILVKHKKDKKGLGSDGNDADVWWERLFDGQLKTLDVTSSSNGVSFETNATEAENHLRRSMSPLYKMFVKGEGLAGTVGKTDNAHLKATKLDSKQAIEETENLMKKTKKETKEEKKEKLLKKKLKEKSDKLERKKSKESTKAKKEKKSGEVKEKKSKLSNEKKPLEEKSKLKEKSKELKSKKRSRDGLGDKASSKKLKKTKT